MSTLHDLILAIRSSPDTNRKVTTKENKRNTIHCIEKDILEIEDVIMKLLEVSENTLLDFEVPSLNVAPAAMPCENSTSSIERPCYKENNVMFDKQVLNTGESLNDTDEICTYTCTYDMFIIFYENIIIMMSCILYIVSLIGFIKL